MPKGSTQSPSLHIDLRLPVRIHWVDGVPKILAGGVPVVPFNAALRYRASRWGGAVGGTGWPQRRTTEPAHGCAPACGQDLVDPSPSGKLQEHRLYALCVGKGRRSADRAT
jgi:hypothetical protein